MAKIFGEIFRKNLVFPILSKMLRSLALTALSTLVYAQTGIEQIHVSYTGILGQYSVDFVSPDQNGFVAWSLDNKTFTTANSTSFYFLTIGYMHQGLLDFSAGSTLQPGTPAYYKVGTSNVGWSHTYTVTPVPARYPSEVFAVFGDFGLANDVCMNTLISDAANGVYDSVLHVGDWAYDFEDGASSTGNQFMNLVQGYAAMKPVAPAAGNHEACSLCLGVDELPLSTFNFTQYRARMHSVTLNAGANSGSDNNIYYSFNQGLTHFLVFSAEAYIYAKSQDFINNQLAFMKADLAAVDRTKTPWVVALVHKDWTMEAQAYADFAPILENGGVDVLFCGHVHYYNRYEPFDSVTGQTDSGSVSADGSVYTNPKYMVTIVTGASGDRELDDGCAGSNSLPSYTCSQNYGYGFFTAVNATTATWNFKTVKAMGPGPADYSDSLTIIQDNHGPRN